MDKNIWLKMKIPRELDIRSIGKRFETFEDANKERNIRIKYLRQTVRKDDADVAQILDECRKGNRCWSAVCPVCMRRFRRWLVAQNFRIFKQTKNVKIITLILTEKLCERNELLRLSITNLIRCLRARFKRAGMKKGVLAVGGFEVDWDETLQVWVPHFHLIVKGSTKESRKKLRRSHYKSTDRINRPMKVQSVKNPVEQFTYCLKSYSAKKEKAITSRGKEITVKSRLDTDDHNMALRLFAQYQPQQIVFMRGVKRQKNCLLIRAN